MAATDILLLPGRGLGRKAAEDQNDQRHLLAERPELSAVVEQRTHKWAMFIHPIDQGTEGTCVGHGTKHWQVTAPIIQTKPPLEPTARSIYALACLLDEWKGNDWMDPTKIDWTNLASTAASITPATVRLIDWTYGTSVRASMKVMRALGFVTGWDNAYEVAPALDFLAGFDAAGKPIGGPLVIGTNWYDSMFDTDEEGVLHILPTAKLAGGHCVAVDEYNKRRGTVGGPNSWGFKPKGVGFGKVVNYKGTPYQDGRWELSLEDFERLIKEDGEIVAAREIRRVGQ